MKRSTAWTAALLVSVMLGASGCGLSPNKGPKYTPPPPTDIELLKISKFLTGSFDTSAQAANDADFHHITLNVARIWPKRRDGIWVYAEQAAGGRLDRPYQQRVLHLERIDELSFTLITHHLRDETRWVGAWRDPERFETQPPAVLREKVGCDLRLVRENVYTYAGETEAGPCPSELHGSQYATFSLNLTPRRIESWDRGWDEDGQAVWGTPAPYVFRRVLD